MVVPAPTHTHKWYSYVCFELLQWKHKIKEMNPDVLRALRFNNEDRSGAIMMGFPMISQWGLVFKIKLYITSQSICLKKKFLSFLDFPTSLKSQQIHPYSPPWIMYKGTITSLNITWMLLLLHSSGSAIQTSWWISYCHRDPTHHNWP